MAAGAYGAISGAVQERNARKRMAMAAEEAASPIRSQAARQRVARQEGDAQAAIDSALRAEATAAQQLAQAGEFMETVKERYFLKDKYLVIGLLKVLTIFQSLTM